MPAENTPDNQKQIYHSDVKINLLTSMLRKVATLPPQKTFGLLVVAILLAAIPFTAFITQRQTNTKQNAAAANPQNQILALSSKLNSQQKAAMGIGIDGKLTNDRALFIRIGSPGKYQILKQKGLIENPDQVEKVVNKFKPGKPAFSPPAKILPVIKAPPNSTLRIVGVPGNSTQIISSCGTISQAGNYILNSDLQAGSSLSNCLSFVNYSSTPITNVSLDCQGHTVASMYGNAIWVSGVQKYAISNCTFNNPPYPAGVFTNGQPLVADFEGGQGIMQSNIFNGAGVWVTQFNNSTFSNNHVNSIFFFDHSSGTNIHDNTFTNAWIYATGNGSNNTIANNTIDGGYKVSSVFSDDGIAVTDQTNLNIANNTIKNTSDCSIESVGLLSNAHVSSNTMSNAGFCGIGGWYWNSWLGNTIDHNTVSSSNAFFEIFLLPWTTVIDEPAYYFKDNAFNYNNFQEAGATYNPVKYSSYINMINDDPSLKSKIVLGKNTFTSNAFSTESPAYFAPASMITDGGNNICLPNYAAPLTCAPFPCKAFGVMCTTSPDCKSGIHYSCPDGYTCNNTTCPPGALCANESNTNPVCLPTLTSSPTPSPTPTIITGVKRVFITSTTYNGNLGGLSGADVKCQDRANAANLGGTWKAWLSDGTTDASSRLTHSSSSYQLLNGTSIANSWTDLIDGTINVPINVTEFNKTTTNYIVWTNTRSSGTSESLDIAYTCANWTNSSNYYGDVGSSYDTDSHWTEGGGFPCTGSTFPGALYCFEQ